MSIDRWRGLREIEKQMDRVGASRAANANISAYLGVDDLACIEAEVEQHVAGILSALLIDVERDHNTKQTAARVARMLVREVCKGRFEPAPRLTDFPNASRLDQLYTVGPIAVRSCCSHHLCPIEGEAWCGVIPSERVIGLSKFSRLAEWVMARPQIQEEATSQLADKIAAAISPLGLGVVVRARHTCMTWRGVREPATTMTTSVMRGLLRDQASARAEFLALIEGQRFSCR